MKPTSWTAAVGSERARAIKRVPMQARRRPSESSDAGMEIAFATAANAGSLAQAPCASAESSKPYGLSTMWNPAPVPSATRYRIGSMESGLTRPKSGTRAQFRVYQREKTRRTSIAPRAASIASSGDAAETSTIDPAARAAKVSRSRDPTSPLVVLAVSRAASVDGWIVTVPSSQALATVSEGTGMRNARSSSTDASPGPGSRLSTSNSLTTDPQSPPARNSLRALPRQPRIRPRRR